MKFSARTLAAAALAAMVLSSAPAEAQFAPFVSSAATYGVNISTASTSQVIAAAPNKVTYVTYAHVEAAGTGNFHFAHGNCAGSPTAFGGDISWTAQTGFSGGDGTGPVLVVPIGEALCAVTSASIQISGWLTAAQF